MATFYPFVEKPRKGVAAFQEISEETSQSQAAVLLMLGRQLRGDDGSLTARAAAAASAKHVSATALRSEKEFPVPRLRAPARRLAAAETAGRLAKVHAYKPPASHRWAGSGADPAWAKVYADCAERLYRKPALETAADMFEVCLNHPRDLVKIAAAFSYHRIAAEGPRLVKILADGVRSSDDLERDLAATALARIAPDHSALRRLSRGKVSRKGKKPARTITLIHGTWASDSAWYQPNGDFYNYIKTLRSDLYAGGDFFKWSGGYSDAARADGAALLKKWVADHNEAGLDLMGHSHGANVCMLATQLGMQAGKLVLLSCPVHVDQYMPNFANVRSGVFSIRVKLDLVILADRGGQKFNHPRIKEIVLPIWFNHSATHEPLVWQNNSLGTKIGL